MTKQIIMVLSLSFAAPVFAGDLSFQNFAGISELTRCLQRKNQVTVPPSGFCDTSYFRQVEIKKVGVDTFHIIFTDVNGSYVKLPELNVFHREDKGVIEDARFTNMPEGTIWSTYRYASSRRVYLSKAAFTLFYDGDGVPTLVYTTYDGERSPTTEVSQFFKLKSVP